MYKNTSRVFDTSSSLDYIMRYIHDDNNDLLNNNNDHLVVTLLLSESNPMLYVHANFRRDFPHQSRRRTNYQTRLWNANVIIEIFLSIYLF